MNLTIPSSGFCVIIDKNYNLSGIKHSFESHHAKTADDTDRLLCLDMKFTITVESVDDPNSMSFTV